MPDESSWFEKTIKSSIRDPHSIGKCAMKKYIFILMQVVFLIVSACDTTNDLKYGNDMDKFLLTKSQNLKLDQYSFYFGHQSVGDNILDGIEALQHVYPWINVKIKEGYSGADVKVGMILHSKIGQNFNPVSKILAFYKIIESGVGDSVDVAFFKFCYIDFNSGTNFKEVFKEYKTTMDKLMQMYPDVLFIHATAPLVVVQSGLKAWIKKIIGRPLDGVDDNIVRHQYNELVRKEYGQGIVFDIAEAESTQNGGRRQSFIMDGKTYYSLSPIYTNDGGHLNETGQHHVATVFIKQLLDACDRKVATKK